MPQPPLYALLIGINHYQSNAVPDLRGCLHDVTTMRDLLCTHFGGQEENMTTLTNAAATHAEIRAAFQLRLLAPLQAWESNGRPGEKPAILFYFSGHGSRARSATKLSGYDETLVPHDSRTENVYDIKDWELGEWLAQLTPYTDNVTVILDCCHSGSGTRGEGKAVTNIRGCFDDHRPQPAPDGTISNRKITRGAIDLSNQTGQIGYVLLAACRNDEKAHEAIVGDPPQPQGILTYWLQQTLRTMDPQQPLRYGELYDHIYHHVTRAYHDQTPQCEGDRNRLFLGGSRSAHSQPHTTRTAPQRTKLALAIAEGWSLKAVRERLLQDDIRPHIELALPSEPATLRLAIENGILYLQDGAGQITHHQYNLRDLNPYRRPLAASDFQPVVRHLLALLPARQRPVQPQPDRAADELVRAIEVKLATLITGQDGQTLQTAPLATDPDGNVVIAVDQPFVLSVTNRYAQPLYFTILELGYDRVTSRLYPQIEGANEAVASQKTIELGRSAHRAQQLRMHLPAGLPSVEETIQIIASTAEIQLAPLLPDKPHGTPNPTAGVRGGPLRHLTPSQLTDRGYAFDKDEEPVDKQGIVEIRIKVVAR